VGAAIGFIIIFFVLWGIISSAGKSSTSSYDKLVKRGAPARGILLQVSSTGTMTGAVGRRFEIRQVYIDVEITGQQPYETNANAIIPINLVRDVLPGATVELRVDPNDRTKMAIVGPGTGFVQQALRTA
jgi:hypothetical protein